MGAPPIPLETHSRIIRDRRVVEAARAAEQAAPAQTTNKRQRPKTVANTTDPQSRLMPTRKGFLQGYNAQVAVTADQVIAAVQIDQSPNDIASFVPMMAATMRAAPMLHTETGRPQHVIGIVLADAGYSSDGNLAAPGPDRLIALGKARDHAEALKQRPASGPPPRRHSETSDVSSSPHPERSDPLETTRSDR
jgi:hypothetical protein